MEMEGQRRLGYQHCYFQGIVRIMEEKNSVVCMTSGKGEMDPLVSLIIGYRTPTATKYLCFFLRWA